ncbi:chemotaxis protein CheW [Fodinicurvata halophila]|uniref:Chemotaxis protein CheW n=1 Tax=Fodinicurvata halophila TaxID=1419723 RepID=A0ABV8ULZ0_9PROT
MSDLERMKTGLLDAEDAKEFVTFYIGEQLFGIHVLQVQDILNNVRTTRIPLAPPEITGSLNLRGRIVTAINVRLRIGLPPLQGKHSGMSIVVDHHGELYSLMVDSVGEVMPLQAADFERSPPTISQRLKEYSEGIYRLQDRLLVVLNIDRLLDFGRASAA